MSNSSVLTKLIIIGCDNNFNNSVKVTVGLVFMPILLVLMSR